MRSPALALTWEIWARHRRLNILAGGYLVLVCLWGLLLPIPEVLAGWLLFPLIAGGMLVITSAAHGCRDSRLEAAASGLPARLLVLPVPAWTLAGITCLWAMLPVFLTTLLATLCLIRPLAHQAPLFWPGLLMATLAGWLVAMTWMPFPLPGLRPVVVSIQVVGSAVVAIVASEAQVPEGVLAGYMLGQWPLIYGLMVVAVRQARRGEGLGARWPVLSLPWQGRSRPRSFSSPFRALFWLRRRARLWSFLVMSAICMLVCWPAVWFLEQVLLDESWFQAYMEVSHMSRSMGVAWLTLSPLVFVLALSVLFGGELALHEGPRGADFVFIRPVTNWQVIRVKLVGAALWLAGVWTAVVLAALAWAGSRGHLGEMIERVIEIASDPRDAVLLAAGLLAGLFLLGWAHMAAGLCIGLSGRRWVTVTAGCLVIGLLSGSSIIAVEYFTNPAGNQWLPRILPGALLALLLLKGASVCLVWRILLRWRLATGAGLAAVGLSWVAGTLLLSGLVVWLAPADSISPGILVAVVVLAMPLARPSLAPLALAWNRHR